MRLFDTYYFIPSKEALDKSYVKQNPECHINTIRPNQSLSTQSQDSQKEVCRSREARKEHSHKERLVIKVLIARRGSNKSFRNTIDREKWDVVTVDSQHIRCFGVR